MSNTALNNLYAAFNRHFPADLSADLLVLPNGIRFNYLDLESGSAQVANALVDMGLQRGDRVSVQVEKSPVMLWLYAGVVRAGMVFHPLNTAYTSDELDYFISDAQPSLVVCDPSRNAEFETLCLNNGIPKPLTLDVHGQGSFPDCMRDSGDTFETVQTTASDTAALLYSSGTTGRPKGIMLSHDNLINNAQALVDCWRFTSEDCLLHALPIFHVHGLFVGISCVLMSGASMRWLPRFEPAMVLEHLPHSTVMMGVPTYYTRLLADPDFGRKNCANVRLFVSGSAPLLADTFAEFEQRTGMAILERYGMTETGMNTSNPLQGERRAGTVGFPLPGVALRIVDEKGQNLPVGEVGDLHVKGPNVFTGYWKLPEKTAEDFTDDGYFITGDKGQIDADGYVSIVGRAKDMVISGGLNVYPKEIELIIDELPGVRESAVIGLPHADFGEAVAAVVVAEENTKLTKEQIIGELKNRVANYKVPKHVFIIDELPRNTMGKVQKNVLRRRYA